MAHGEGSENKYDSLARFSKAYSIRLSELFKDNSITYFEHHKDTIDIITTFIAKDGIVTFYAPGPGDGTVQSGYYLFDNYRDKTLNEICQALSVHRLKVSVPEIGTHHTEIDLVPPDTAGIPTLNSPWIHNDIREAIRAGKLASLPGMTITPVMHFEKGICTSLQAGRTKIWSPVVNFPGVGDKRLYLWTHADFWWKPEKLNWREEEAIAAANNDFIAFDTALKQSPFFDGQTAQQDSPTHAADILDNLCEELSMLLEEFGGTEEKIHQWLYNEKHQIFLNSDIKRIWSKLPFGSKVSDFVIEHSDATYTLIEIERANLRIFRKSDSELTADFNHACQQVSDWQRYIRDNAHTVRSELKLKGIYEPKGMVVMGRSAEIDKPDAETRWTDKKNRHEHAVFTYDEIIERVKALAHQLRRLTELGV